MSAGTGNLINERKLAKTKVNPAKNLDQKIDRMRKDTQPEDLDKTVKNR